MITFVVITLVLLFIYEAFVMAPAEKRAEQARARAVAAGPAIARAAPPQPRLSLAQALALSPRVKVDTPSLSGSIALKGARIDDLFLKGYHTEVAKTSPLVELLRPEGMKDAYFAEFGWVAANLPGLPTSDTLWTVTSGDTLSPGHPVVLGYTAPGGLTFSRRIDIDDKFMFTLTDTVTNTGAAPVTLLPYFSAQRQGLPDNLNKINLVHEGAIGILGLDSPDLKLATYPDLKKKGEVDWPSKGGWLGFTDKYWMTAFVPAQDDRIDAKSGVTTDRATGIDIYATSYTASTKTIAPGGQIVEITHLFTGAKNLPVLQDYQKRIGVPRFDDAVDWGHLWFLTKPIFWLVERFHQWVGNFGVAILMLTVVIRGMTFPLANKGFEMGVKMKKLQPQLKELQARLKDDPQAQQKEMMALYAKEKVNPVTGCLPILLTLPVFFALTKIFYVTIEMRHAPFFGWIHDLSARDPTTIMNLFGLIPWDPSTAPLLGSIFDGFLHVGVWALLYGASMWLSTSMTPQTGVDPTQQKMLKIMPLMFTFIMAGYPAGLLIYWTWSSLISILQQYVMMRRFKVENPIDDFFARFSAKPQPSG